MKVTSILIILISLGGALLMADSDSVPSPASLKFLSYNLGLLHAMGSDHVPEVKKRAKAAPAALAAMATELKADIILLQELWTGKLAAPIEKAMMALGYKAYRPRNTSIIGLNSGLILFVKAPYTVGTWSFKPFKKTTFIDSLAKKGILRARIENADGGAFFFLGTHTVAVDTKAGIPDDAAQLAAMNAQMRELRDALIEEGNRTGLPVLLAGDFNAGPAYVEESYRIIADSPSVIDVAEILYPGAQPPTWDRANPLVAYGNYPNEPDANIDHVFLLDSKSAAWKVVAAQAVGKESQPGLFLKAKKGVEPVALPLSDHYGWFAELELVANGSAD